MSSTEQPTELSINASLSALMDGEASDLDVRRVLKAEDADLGQCWQRFHLAAAAMRKDSDLGFGSVDLSASISAAIAREPSLLKDVDIEAETITAATHTITATKDKMVSLWSNLGRLAIAASVAGAVVVGVQFNSNHLTNSVAVAPEMSVAPRSGQPVLGDGTNVRAVGTQAQAARPRPIIINDATQQQVDVMKQEVNRLMLEHAENATQNTQNGVMPFVRVPDSE
ncbi:MAG: sigma-E factor negative regulatory protein RseA [Pseudohongiellaceae bacterium]|jgi:sigma-E factor negative regulatory protein RseA